jgi:hypothetical protein
VFVLAFVVEFEIGYNPFMHKTQPQKLFFIAFLSFFGGFHIQNSTSTSKTNTLLVLGQGLSGSRPEIR